MFRRRLMREVLRVPHSSRAALRGFPCGKVKPDRAGRPGFAAPAPRGTLAMPRWGVAGQGDWPVELDNQEILAEVRAVFDRYEAALMANETAVLDEIFWADPRTVRFGVTEILYGHDAIRAFRASVKGYVSRTQKKVHIVAFGRDFAATHLEFQRVGAGPIGRETKIMARLPEGWRVVSAHVSLLAEPAR